LTKGYAGYSDEWHGSKSYIAFRCDASQCGARIGIGSNKVLSWKRICYYDEQENWGWNLEEFINETFCCGDGDCPVDERQFIDGKPNPTYKVRGKCDCPGSKCSRHEDENYRCKWKRCKGDEDCASGYCCTATPEPNGPGKSEGDCVPAGNVTDGSWLCVASSPA